MRHWRLVEELEDLFKATRYKPGEVRRRDDGTFWQKPASGGKLVQVADASGTPLGKTGGKSRRRKAKSGGALVRAADTTPSRPPRGEARSRGSSRRGGTYTHMDDVDAIIDLGDERPNDAYMRAPPLKSFRGLHEKARQVWLMVMAKHGTPLDINRALRRWRQHDLVSDDVNRLAAPKATIFRRLTELAYPDFDPVERDRVLADTVAAGILPY